VELELEFHMGDHSDSSTGRNIANVRQAKTFIELIRYTRLLFSLVLLLSIVACKKIYVPIRRLEDLSDISTWILHHLNLPRNPAEPKPPFSYLNGPRVGSAYRRTSLYDIV